MGARPKLGISPIIATIFLIFSAVLVGALFLGWQVGWFKVQAREGLVAVQVESVSSSNIQQVVIIVKNVGNVKVTLLGIDVGIDKNDGTLAFEVYPEGLVSSLKDGDNDGEYEFIEINIDGAITLEPSDKVTISVRVYGTGWTGGKSYLVMVVYRDELGNSLTKAESFVV